MWIHTSFSINKKQKLLIYVSKFISEDNSNCFSNDNVDESAKVTKEAIQKELNKNAIQLKLVIIKMLGYVQHIY